MSSEDEDDINQSDLDEASALQASYHQKYVSRQPPSSLSSSDVDDYRINTKQRQSAFASVTSADKPPKHSEKIEMRQFNRSITPNKAGGKKRETFLHNDMTSPSVTSTLSEHESEITEPRSALSSRLSQKSPAITESHGQQTTRDSQSEGQQQNRKLHLSMYDSDSDSSTLQSEHEEADAIKPEVVHKQSSMPSGIKIAVSTHIIQG